MLVRVYDPITENKPKWSQNLRGIINKVVSLSYTRRAYDIGSFEMVVPYSEENKSTLATDTILICGDVLKTATVSETTQKTISNNAFYVTAINETDEKTIRVSGYDLKYLLSFRVTLFPKDEQDKGTYGYYVTKGTTFHCVSDLIDYNLARASDEKRRIFGFGRIVMPINQKEQGLTGITDDRYMTRLEPLSSAIFKLLKNCKTHYYEVRIMIDETADNPDGYVPRMASGEDKTQLIVTPEMYNISAYDKTEDVSAYKNVIYAVSNSGSSTTTIVQAVSKDTSIDSGITRKEVVLDVDADTVDEIPEYALKAAEEYETTDDFEITPIFDGTDDILLAQKVIVKLGTHTYESIVTEITDEYSEYKHSCSFVVGDKKIKALNVLNKAVASSNQKTINNKIAVSNTANIETAIVVQERNLQQVIHNFTEIGYIAGNTIGFGGVGNSIVIGGYVTASGVGELGSNPDLWYGEISFPKMEWNGDLYSNVKFYIHVYSISGNRSHIVLKFSHDEGVYTFPGTGPIINGAYGLGLIHGDVYPPDSEFEYGSAIISVDVAEQGATHYGGYKFRLPFQSEAEYNAAIGLTNTPLELVKIQDFQYLMPESQVIVDKSLSPDSDNVIANSAVAKALDLKADKTALETLSLEVDSKANTVDVDAISEQVNAKADKTEVQSIAQALGNKADSSALVSHTGDTKNPHKVTKEQIGLSKVENKSSSDVLSELNFVGENMLENSTFHSNFSGWTFTHNASSEITQKDGMFCGHFSGVIGESTSLRQSVLDDIDKDNLGQLYTFSADIRLDGYVAGTTNPFAQIYFSATYDNNGTNTSFNATTVSGNPNCVLYNNQGWKRIYWTVKFSRVPNSLYAFVYARDFTGDLYFKNLKLEKGSVPTAYTPSVADYTGLLDRVSALEATLLSLGGET